MCFYSRVVEFIGCHPFHVLVLFLILLCTVAFPLFISLRSFPSQLFYSVCCRFPSLSYPCVLSLRINFTVCIFCWRWVFMTVCTSPFISCQEPLLVTQPSKDRACLLPPKTRTSPCIAIGTLRCHVTVTLLGACTSLTANSCLLPPLTPPRPLDARATAPIIHTPNAPARR